MDRNTDTITRTTTTPLEAAGIITICFGWAIYASIYAVLNSYNVTASSGTGSGGGNGFSDGQMIVTILLEVVCAAAALYILHARKYAIATLYPEPKIMDAGIGILLYIAVIICYWIFITPFYAGHAQQPIQQMVKSATVSLGAVIPAAIVNGAYEEIFLLGFLLRGLRGFGLSNAVGISLLVRTIYHLYQGPVGALSIFMVGLIFSLWYVRTGRLFPVVFAHILSDIVPFL